jgi:hypothetical protein
MVADTRGVGALFSHTYHPVFYHYGARLPRRREGELKMMIR